MDNENLTPGQILRYIRLNRGMSQQKLANLCEVSKQVISNMERGVTSFKDKHKLVSLLSHYLECKPDVFTDNKFIIHMASNFMEPKIYGRIKENLISFKEGFKLLCQINETSDKKEKEILLKFMKCLLDK